MLSSRLQARRVGRDGLDLGLGESGGVRGGEGKERCRGASKAECLTVPTDILARVRDVEHINFATSLAVSA
jgi:hypothetical protein